MTIVESRDRFRDPRSGYRLARLGPSIFAALPGRIRRALPGWRGVLVWEEAVGPEAARRSRAVAFRDGRLIVEVAGSVWMHHLTAIKRNLLSQVNLAIGEPAVEDILFVLNPTLGGSQAPRPIR